MPKTEPGVEHAYDSPSWWYDIRGYFILRLTYRSKLKPLLKFFSRNVGPKHLEAAIGSGSFFYLLLKQSSEKPQFIEAFDYSENMLNGARKKFKHDPCVHIIQADVGFLPYENNTFDTVNVANAIHCFPNIQQALKELYRVLKPKGIIAANVLLYPRGNRFSNWLANKINAWGIKKGILYKPYHIEEIKHEIRGAGFSIFEENIVGNMYNFKVKKLINE